MPKFETYTDDFSGRTDLTFQPSEGDVRIRFGNIEYFQNGGWVISQNIDTLYYDMVEVKEWKRSIINSHDPILRDMDLEQSYPDLKEAGEYLLEAERAVREVTGARKKLRLAYQEMQRLTAEKQKIFDILSEENDEESLDDMPF